MKFLMKNNNNVESIIALNIIQAQMASDAGKGKKNLALDKSLERGPMRMGYSLKETYILRALRLIRNNKTQFNYWVEIEKAIGTDYISKFAQDYLILKTCDDVEKDNISTLKRKNEEIKFDALIDERNNPINV